MNTNREPTGAERYFAERRKNPIYEANYQAARAEIRETNEAVNSLVEGGMVSLSFPRRWLEQLDMASVGLSVEEVKREAIEGADECEAWWGVQRWLVAEALLWKQLHQPERTKHGEGC